MEPVDRALRNVFSHALYSVVESPAVVAIKVAFPFGKQVRNDRMQVSRQHPRFQIRKSPATHSMHDLCWTILPIAILREIVFVAAPLQFGPTWEGWCRQGLLGFDGRWSGPHRRLHKQLVKFNVQLMCCWSFTWMAMDFLSFRHVESLL